MYDSVSTLPSLAQIFSLDVTALSDRLDLSENELLAGLHGNAVLPDVRKRSLSHASTPRALSYIDDPLAYVACLVVSDRQAVSACRDKACSVLELTLRRLVGHRQCARIVVCVTHDALHADVHAIVRAVQHSPSVATTIDVLVGDADAVAAVQHAVMYVDATTMSSSKDTPFVLVRVESRVFEVATIDELVHQQQNAQILTDGFTSAVRLVDTVVSETVPVGLWVCVLRAPLDHIEASAKWTCVIEPQDPASDILDAWLASVVGPLHCENVIATAEFNWEELQPVTNALAFRFEPTENNQASAHDDSDDDDNESTTAEWTALAAIQAELYDDGIHASLFPVDTSVVQDAAQAPTSTVDLLFDLPKPSVVDERSALLSTTSRTTVLSEIDLEGPDHPVATDGPSNAHAYLIHVDRPETEATPGGPTTPELVFALPDDLTHVLETDAALIDDSDLEGLPPLLRIRRRSIDHLPSSVTQVTLRAVILDEPKPQPRVSATRRVSVVLHVEKQVPVVGYLILLTALFAVSSKGAVLDLLVGVPPLLKLFWRMSGVSLTLAPVAILSMARKGAPQLPSNKRWLALVCVVAYATYNATFLVALSLTSIGHVYIFANSHSLIMVVGKLVLREPLGALELLGAALGFSGGVVTTLDRSRPADTAQGKEPKRAIMAPTPLGDAVAFSGAFAGVAYLLSAKKLRSALGVRVFLFLLTTGVALLLLPILILSHAALGIRVHEPFHPTQGLLGWVHHLDIELYLVLICSVCGTMGFIASLKYFDPIVVSVTMLTEPVVATIFSIFVGVERFPAWPTIVGGLAVILGCLLVLLASHHTSQTIDVSNRLVKTPFTSAATVLRGPDDYHMASASSLSMSSSSVGRRRATTYGSLA